MSQWFYTTPALPCQRINIMQIKGALHSYYMNIIFDLYGMQSCTWIRRSSFSSYLSLPSGSHAGKLTARGPVVKYLVSVLNPQRTWTCGRPPFNWSPHLSIGKNKNVVVLFARLFVWSRVVKGPTYHTSKMYYTLIARQCNYSKINFLPPSFDNVSYYVT